MAQVRNRLSTAPASVAAIYERQWPAIQTQPAAQGQWVGPLRAEGLDVDAQGLKPHALPVPLPAERRNVDTDFEHLAAWMHCRVRESGRVLFDGTSELAGLETGSLP